MTDLAGHADRVAQIANAVHGRVIGRSRNVVTIEVPADCMAGADLAARAVGLTQS
jgi:hypothetical protein